MFSHQSYQEFLHMVCCNHLLYLFFTIKCKINYDRHVSLILDFYIISYVTQQIVNRFWSACLKIKVSLFPHTNLQH